MPGLTQVARRFGQPTPAEARIVAALTALGAELAVTMPAHSSQLLRSQLVSAASTAFPPASAGSGAGTAVHHAPQHASATHVAGRSLETAKTGVAGAKIASAVAPIVAPMAATLLAINLAIGGAAVATRLNHSPNTPTARILPPITGANHGQTAIEQALQVQLARLGVLEHAYDEFTPAQLKVMVAAWTIRTQALINRLTDRTSLARFVVAERSEVARLEPVLPPAVLAVLNAQLQQATGLVKPTPSQVPSLRPMPTPHPSGGKTGVPVPLPTLLPSVLPNPVPSIVIPTLPPAPSGLGLS